MLEMVRELNLETSVKDIKNTVRSHIITVTASKFQYKNNKQ